MVEIIEDSLVDNKTKSKMKVLRIYKILLFIYGTQAMCPTLKVHPKDSFHFNLFEKFLLYQFKPVDHFAQTPFYELGGATRRSLLGSLSISTQCSYGTSISYFNRILFMDFNNKSNKFDLDYEDNDSLFCSIRNKMSKIYLIDFEANYLASLYGCEMFLVNGTMTKVEGVLIFLKFHRNNFTVSTDAISRLNYTYDVLQNQANLSRTTLETQETDMDKITDESCKNVIDMKEHCKKKKPDNPLPQIIIPEKFKISNEIVIVLICSGFLITIVVSMACAKQNTPFL